MKKRGMTTQGCTPGFLRKSAQPAGRMRDSCDPKNERVRKRLKTRRDEYEKLVTRAGEQRGEEDRGGVRRNRLVRGAGQVCAQVSRQIITQE
jgi:hypothetical protein